MISNSPLGASLATTIWFGFGCAIAAAQPPGQSTGKLLRDYGYQERGIMVTPVQGCNFATPPFDQSGAKSQVAALTACVNDGHGTSRLALDGAIVYSGESVTFAMQTAIPAYVQLVQLQDGFVTTLWPAQEQGSGRALRAGATMIVPDGPYRFTFDDHLGPFTIFMVVSTRPLERADPALFLVTEKAKVNGGVAASSGIISRRSRKSAHERVQRRAASTTDTQTSRPVQNQSAPLRERGIVVELLAGGPALVASPDDRGVAIIEFRFDHRSPVKTEH